MYLGDSIKPSHGSTVSVGVPFRSSCLLRSGLLPVCLQSDFEEDADII